MIYSMFKTRIDQLNFDDIHDNFQKQYRMNDKGSFLLKDENLLISYSKSLTKIELPNIKQFLCDVPDYTVCYRYLIVIIVKCIISLIT